VTRGAQTQAWEVDVATFEDLEKEVRRLRVKVNRLGGTAVADNARAVEAIVDISDGDERLIVSGGGGFGAACAQSRAKVIEEQKNRARRELQDSPGCIRTPTALQSFRATYNAIPTIELDSIIREFAE
jgi:hypothetical protein